MDTDGESTPLDWAGVDNRHHLKDLAASGKVYSNRPELAHIALGAGRFNIDANNDHDAAADQEDEHSLSLPIPVRYRHAIYAAFLALRWISRLHVMDAAIRKGHSLMTGNGPASARGQRLPRHELTRELMRARLEGRSPCLTPSS